MPDPTTPPAHAPVTAALRAWLLDQSRQAHLLADHPDGQPGDPGGYFDKGAAHMADATLTQLATLLEAATPPTPDTHRHDFRGTPLHCTYPGCRATSDAGLTAERLGVDDQRFVVNYVRQWWGDSFGHSLADAGNDDVVRDDFKDIEAALAAQGIGLTPAATPDSKASDGD